MVQLQLGDDENIDLVSMRAILKVQGHSFFDVVVDLIYGSALREDIFPNAASAPVFAVVVNLNLN